MLRVLPRRNLKNMRSFYVRLLKVERHALKGKVARASRMLNSYDERFNACLAKAEGQGFLVRGGKGLIVERLDLIERLCNEHLQTNKKDRNPELFSARLKVPFNEIIRLIPSRFKVR